MSLSQPTMNVLQRTNTQSKRLRFMLAKLYAANIDIELRAFLLQADNEEMAAWTEIQTVFFEDKGDNETLKSLAEKARIENQTEVAFEQGRKFAYSMPPEEVAEYGLSWRETKNPYLNDNTIPSEIKNAWTSGFQNAFEIISGESW